MSEDIDFAARARRSRLLLDILFEAEAGLTMPEIAARLGVDEFTAEEDLSATQEMMDGFTHQGARWRLARFMRTLLSIGLTQEEVRLVAIARHQLADLPKALRAQVFGLFARFEDVVNAHQVEVRAWMAGGPAQRSRRTRTPPAGPLRGNDRLFAAIEERPGGLTVSEIADLTGIDAGSVEGGLRAAADADFPLTLDERGVWDLTPFAYVLRDLGLTYQEIAHFAVARHALDHLGDNLDKVFGKYEGTITRHAATLRDWLA